MSTCIAMSCYVSSFKAFCNSVNARKHYDIQERGSLRVLVAVGLTDAEGLTHERKPTQTQGGGGENKTGTCIEGTIQ